MDEPGVTPTQQSVSDPVPVTRVPTIVSPPNITSVRITLAGQSQLIYIEGSGFGDVPPQTISLGDGSVDTLGGGTTPSLSIQDNGGGSHTWEAGRQTSSNTAADSIGLMIVKWSNNEIVLGGFGQSLSTSDLGSWNIGSGDPLIVNVWTEGGSTSYNAQTGELLHLNTPQPTLLSSEISQVTSEANSEDMRANLIAQAIDWQNPVVKNFANARVQKTSSGFSSEGEINIAQVADVWQSIHNQWTYVSDPPDYTYWTSASDSINNGLRGNCADYAILNAAVIVAIGGSARVIRACPPDGSICHAYAEELTDPTARQSISDYIGKRYGSKSINWHIETDFQGNTQYWLNLDWQANYPGGPYFKDNGIYDVYYPNGYHETLKETEYSQ